MSIDAKVIEQVSNELQRYVYLLVDPETGVPFYVGKGHGVRHAAHAAEAARVVLPVDESGGGSRERSKKLETIRRLQGRGLEPEVWILRYGLTPRDYTSVEAATIDLLMSFPIASTRDGTDRFPLGASSHLTNGRREWSEGGITTLQALIDTFAAPPLTTDTPLLLITLNGWVDLPDGETIAGGRTRYGAGFRPEWLVKAHRDKAYDAIGESVSAWWSLDRSALARRGVEYVVAVNKGVTRGLFRIDPSSWEEDRFHTRSGQSEVTKRAFWFEPITAGPLFEEVVGPHGHRVPPKRKGAQNAIAYWPNR